MRNTVEQGVIFRHGDLTRRILACAMEVQSELGPGFLESVYGRALALAFEEAGLFAEEQKPLPVRFKNHLVGTFYADFVVEESVVLELKAARAWAPEHEAQLIHYLKATGLEVGLLLNFGKARLDFRRLVRHQDFSDLPSET